MNRSMTDTSAARNVRVDALVGQMRRTERAALAQAIERQDMAEIERAGIAKRIKRAREEIGLSQPEMADALGVIPRTYQNYESVSKPRTPWGSMNEIAKVTGKTTEWLIHGDKAATPDLMPFLEPDQLARIERCVRQNYEMIIRIGGMLADSTAEEFAAAFEQHEDREDRDDEEEQPGSGRA